ncbi:hypothetical protein ACTWJ9_33425 (plasmid) [Streptomyces sp. GDS52]|uniref:hypothetical protein n=1 Tax=Streptomyces sp. GDS52 TaxID=3406419 RepID=UPI003FD61A15
MNTSQPETVLAALVRRATAHLPSPAVAVQLPAAGWGCDDVRAWNVEDARVMCADGTETAVDLHQAARPEEDALFGLVRRPAGEYDVLSLDVTPAAESRELSWEEYEELHRPADTARAGTAF